MNTIPRETPAHVYALAEHVELRSSDWWGMALDLTAQFVLFEHMEGLEHKEVIRLTKRELHADLEGPLIEKRLSILLQDGFVHERNKKLYLSESKRQEYSRMQAEATRLESENKEIYIRLTLEYGSLIQQIPEWLIFTEQLLIPLINELGAETLNLLSGSTHVIKTHANQRFLQRFKETEQPYIQAFVVKFLDPSRNSIRKYVLGYLNRYMLASASSVDRVTLDSLQKDGRKPVFKIVLDTNVIFSILNIHLNPSNETSESFLELTQLAHEYADIGLYVLSSTIAESIGALEGALHAAPSGNITGPIARAGRSAGQISGLVGRYIETVAEGAKVTPTSYFQPYINNMEIILGDLGISIIDDSESIIRERVSFLDKVRDWLADDSHDRSRAKIVHDIHALEFVKEKRKDVVKSLVDAEWWLMTADFGLQRYEKKSMNHSSKYALSMNPGEMVQILRFWVPRSEYLAQALVSGIRLPFVFHKFGPQTESISLRILDKVSNYSNAQEFSESVVTQILTDEALRSGLLDSRLDDEAVGSKIEASIARNIVAAEKNIRIRDAEIEKLNRELKERDLMANRQSVSTERVSEIANGKERSKQNRISALNRAEKEVQKQRNALRELRLTQENMERQHQSELSKSKVKYDALQQTILDSRKSRSVLTAWLAASLFLIVVAVFFVMEFSLNLWMSLLISLFVGILSLLAGMVACRLF